MFAPRDRCVPSHGELELLAVKAHDFCSLADEVVCAELEQELVQEVE